MRSPFAIFRKHQKLMTVILTGLAMFAFVILGAVQDPANMPTGLIVIFVACTLGAIGWVAGIRSKKSNEFGVMGLFLGAALAIGGTLLGGPPTVVKADTGNIDEQQFAYLRNERDAANEFIYRVYAVASQKDRAQFMQQPSPFQYHVDAEKDVVVGELLRREAEEMGLTITDESVNDYLNSISQQQLTRDELKEIRNQMGLSESDLYNILRDQLSSRLAAQYMYQGTVLPPESYWEFYKKLNVRESVSIVPLAVSMFVDESAEPTDAELQELFDAHKDNYPNSTDEGQLDEGRPGFHQPRRVQLAYVEAAYDEIEKTVTPPTDEEIEAFYEENYKSISSDELKGQSDGPVDGPALTGPEEDLPAGKIDGEDLPPVEEETEDLPPGEEAIESPADESEEGAGVSRTATIHPVAFFDDTEPAETTDAPAADAPPADAPATEGDSVDAPASSPPPPPLAEASESNDAAPGEAPAVPAPATAPQAPTAPEVRPLDDQLRQEIIDQILRERTGDRLQEVINETTAYMRDLGLRMLDPEDFESHLSHEAARAMLKTYAEEHGLVYAETPLLSQLELSDSEEYPIGRAVDRLFSNPFDRTPVTDVVSYCFSSRPQEVYARAQSVVQPDTDSRFAYWKIDDQAEYVPESLSDRGIREQVVAEWRELKARDVAQARADELAKLADGSEALLSEALAGQTITGAEGSPSVSVLNPPAFSWMTKADPRMSPNPFMTPPPEMTRLRTIPGRIGESFMQTVFEDLQENAAGVAHSMDKEYYYVVKVFERTYGRFENIEQFREQFLSEQLFAPYQFSDYPKLAQGELQQYRTDWSKELFEKHGVEIIEREVPEPKIDEEMPDEEPISSAY